MNSPCLSDVLTHNLTEKLFSGKYQILPNLDDVYELELAFYESQILSDSELLKNGAYFANVGAAFTRHFLMCTGKPLKLPVHSSTRLRSFFEKNIFRTGYATHGLFPYRGKFHPQMIKALINIMGLKPGDMILDPMMGSGTVLVEASLMGIRSTGIDASPFCRFMTQTKLDALTMSLARARKALTNYDEVFDYFQKKAGNRPTIAKTERWTTTDDSASVMESAAKYATKEDRSNLTMGQKETSDTYNFLLLAYLDSVGYSERSQRKTPLEQFKAVLERYLFVAEKIQSVLGGAESELAFARAIEGDARNLPLEDSSVNGIIFSPPYSFAIDYLKNDAFHLNYLGVDIKRLRDFMVGLRGKSLADKFEVYQRDMKKVLSECSRVLRSGGICTIIVGTNNNQLGKVLGVPADQVPGLHKILVEMGSKSGFDLLKMISRPITGISSTMRREYILMLCKK